MCYESVYDCSSTFPDGGQQELSAKSPASRKSSSTFPDGGQQEHVEKMGIAWD